MITLKDLMDKLGPLLIETKEGWMPITEGYCKGFDLDLKFGKMGEEFVSDVLEGNSKIEVKTERDIWKTTGNIAIEIRCDGKPSGLSTTESTVWIHLLAYKGVIEGGFLFKVEQLKEKIKKLHKSGDIKMVMGGDNNVSQMVLLPIDSLFKE